MRRRGLVLKILAAADPPAELRPPLAERTRGPQVLGKAVVLHLDDGTGSKKFACGLLDACSGVGIPSSWDGTNWADDESACTNLGGSDAGCETLLATPELRAGSRYRLTVRNPYTRLSRAGLGV